MYDLLVRKPGTQTGGAERQLMMISHALAERGMPIDFLVSSEGIETVEVLDGGIRVVRGIAPHAGPKFLRALPPVVSLVRSLKKIDADLYYVWGAGRVAGIVGRYCKDTNTPYVFAARHEMDVDGSRVAKLGPLDRWIFSQSIMNAPGISVQTRTQGEILRRNYGRTGTQVNNVRAILKDADPGSERDCITWAGSFQSIKRPDWFVQLASRFPEQKFVMIGGRFASEPGVFDRIRESAAGLPNLTLTGQLPYDETPKYMKRSLVHVLTSTKEGFPNVLLEAWSGGTPAITTFDPDGVVAEHGLGYHCESIDEIAERLRLLLDSDNERRRIGAKAIGYVRDFHDPDKTADQLMNWFTELAGRKATFGRG